MIPLPPDYTRSRRDQRTWEWTTAVVCSISLERKQECRTLSPCNGASGIRQPRTTGSSRLCMTRWQKSPSSTPARSVSASSLSGADDPKVLAARKRVTRPRPRQSHVAAVRPNAGQMQQAEAQRKAAQTVFSVHIRGPSSRLLSYATKKTRTAADGDMHDATLAMDLDGTRHPLKEQRSGQLRV